MAEKAQAGRYEVTVTALGLRGNPQPRGRVVELTSDQAERFLRLGAVKVHEATSKRSVKPERKPSESSKSDEE